MGPRENKFQSSDKLNRHVKVHHCVTIFPALKGHMRPASRGHVLSNQVTTLALSASPFEPNMAFKIPLLDPESLKTGYFRDVRNFRWADVTDKDEIGKGTFGSVIKALNIPENRTVVVKRFFAEGDSSLKIVAKEPNMLQNLRHPKVAEFVAVCPKPVAIMME